MSRRLQLDPPLRIGACAVAVLCEVRASAQDLGGAILADGHKVPLAVLVAQPDGAITASDLCGRPLDPAVLHAACPGLLRALTGARTIPP